MEKFLIFIDDADDAVAMPLSTILGMTIAADGAVLINFQNRQGPSDTDADGGGKRTFVTLTCTADTELAVFKSLADQIGLLSGGAGFKSQQSPGGNYLVVCDDVNGEFAHPDILSCAIFLNS